jgi:UDP-sugar pyrophosphorylase
MTCNVEYNLLDPLLRATIAPETGDADDPATGLSPFPGNINQIVLKLEPYCATLDRTGGVIGEFVNPKYADPSDRSGAFKSSTRLECMMQDYPRSLPEGARVGFTVVNQAWAAYSPVKNGAAAAAAKAGAGEPTHSAAAAEFDLYKSACRALQLACGCALPDGDAAGAPRVAYAGVPVEADWPRVVLSPGFAPTLSELQRRVGGGGGGGGGKKEEEEGGGAPSRPPITLSARSVLVLDGPDIEVRGPLEVDGALVVRAVPGARVVVGPMRVCNAGWEWRALPEGGGGGAVREEDAMRGFVVERNATAEYVFDAPGDYALQGDGQEETGQPVRQAEEEEARVLVAA